MADSPATGPIEFEIAFVCTANQFRSPIAEAAVRELTKGLPVRVRSAGVLELGNAAALPEAIRAAGHLELDVSSHRTRSLRQTGLATADLVLGFERRHIIEALREASARRERLFIMPELVGLLPSIRAPSTSDPIERARIVVDEAQAVRAFTKMGGSSVPELEDPAGAGWPQCRDTAIRIWELSVEVVEALFGITVSPRPAESRGVSRGLRRRLGCRGKR